MQREQFPETQMDSPGENQAIEDKPLEELANELSDYGRTASSEEEPDFYRQGFEVVKQIYHYRKKAGWPGYS